MSFKKSFKEEPVVFLFSKMWRFAKGYRHLVIIFILMSLVAQLIWLTPPIIFAKILNELQTNGLNQANIKFIYFCIASLFVVRLFSWAFHGPSRVMERRVAYFVDRNYKKYLYNAVLSLPIAWHADRDSGDLIDKVNKATESLFGFSRNIFVIIRFLVRTVGTIAILIFFDLYVALLAITLLFIVFYIIARFDKILVPQYRAMNVFDNRSSAKVYDSISNVVTVKVLSIESPVQESINTSWLSSYPLYIKNKKLVELKWFTGSQLLQVVILFPLTLYIYVQYTAGAAILAGTISALYVYLSNLDGVFDTFASMYEEYMIFKARIKNVSIIEDEFESRNISKRKIFKDWKKVKVENLNFDYDLGSGQKVRVLKDFNFSFNVGEKIAVIGESGSGKSTLLKVLHGMYENVKADMEIDTKRFENYEIGKINILSTLVPQEPEVFSASIKENLTLLLEFTDEQIKNATDMAMFSEVVEALPNKIESIVNEKGVNLSGGQKQRLALARALLFSGNKKLILLDESTSSVDPNNEVKIYQNIFNNFKEATILASIHKMNLLKYFDRILIMEEGKIVADGSFEYLLENNIEFKNSWEEYIKNGEAVEI